MVDNRKPFGDRVSIRSFVLMIVVGVASVLIGGSVRSAGAEAPSLSTNDRIRIAEAFRIADEIGDSVWTDWSKTPFAILLVTNDYEFLIRHPWPTDDFKFISYDSLLQSKIYYRDRQFPTNILATFPALDNLSTVVIGQPENTSSNTSTRWVLTLLHEHFHQLQNGLPDYYSAVESLDLSGGDKTGMWMLNYDFPYDSTPIIESFSRLCAKLSGAIGAIGSDDFASKLAEYLNQRKGFESILSSDDYRYFSFQIWAEGVARHTEYVLATIGDRSYRPTEDFSSLADFTSLGSAAEVNYAETLFALPNIDLSKFRRGAFYYFGTAEAILLDSVNPTWRDRFFLDKFCLESLYEK